MICVLSFSLVFIFFSNSENKMKHFVCVRDAIFIQFKIFLCLYSVKISNFCLIKALLSCYPFIFFAFLLFFCKGEKNTKRKKSDLSLTKATVPPCISQQNHLYSIRLIVHLLFTQHLKL